MYKFNVEMDKNGVSQAALAKRCDISKETVNQIYNIHNPKKSVKKIKARAATKALLVHALNELSINKKDYKVEDFDWGESPVS